MAFVVSSVTVDLLGGTATLVGSDHSHLGAPVRVIQVQFPFQPSGPGVQGAIDAAKAVLQQAAQELGPPTKP